MRVFVNASGESVLWEVRAERWVPTNDKTYQGYRGQDAAAFSHAQKAQNLLTAKQPEAALAEAEQAVALAPNAVVANATLGDVLTAPHRNGEARAQYQRALEPAQTVEPEFQDGWVPGLKAKLAGK
jgi:predicted Zn-dependent protease